MWKCVRSCLLLGLPVLTLMCVASSWAEGASQPHYLVTNDDVPFGNGVTFYTVEPNGALGFVGQLETGGGGISGGFFATNRISLLNSPGNQCVYASDAATGDIVGINVNTIEVGGTAFGSDTDSGATNGIGMAMNGQYLYAGFTTSNTIGTFQVQSDCSLSFVNDVAVVGLQAGFINGIAVHGNMLVATFGDGSIASYDISSGTPVSNGDEQNSTGYVKAQGTTYPNQVEISKDGRFAIFGDTSTSTMVEVSDLSTGRLNTTVAYALGTTLNSSNILLSPDETLLYIGNTQGAKITAAFFDKTTGKITAGCSSGTLRGYVSNWSYVAGLALETNTGTGNTIYAAEFGGPSYIAMVGVTSSGGKCTLQELANSPVSASDSSGLLSIGVYPPRAF